MAHTCRSAVPPPWIFTPYSWGLLVDEGWVFFFPTGRFASKSTFKKRAVVERVWVRVEESAFERRDCRFMAEGGCASQSTSRIRSPTVLKPTLCADPASMPALTNYHAQPPPDMCPSLHLRTSAAARDTAIAPRSFGYPPDCPVHPSSTHGSSPAPPALTRAAPWTQLRLLAHMYRLDVLTCPELP